MFAVIRTGGKQYKVSPGDTITIEKLPSDSGQVTFEEVLLVGGDKVTLGKPVVTNAKVVGDILRGFRGEKIRVFKYHPKAHWSRTHGHRQDLTQVMIKDIVVGKDKKEA